MGDRREQAERAALRIRRAIEVEVELIDDLEEAQRFIASVFHYLNQNTMALMQSIAEDSGAAHGEKDDATTGASPGD